MKTSFNPKLLHQESENHYDHYIEGRITQVLSPKSCVIEFYDGPKKVSSDKVFFQNFDCNLLHSYIPDPNSVELFMPKVKLRIFVNKKGAEGFLGEIRIEAGETFNVVGEMIVS